MPFFNDDDYLSAIAREGQLRGRIVRNKLPTPDFATEDRVQDNDRDLAFTLSTFSIDPTPEAFDKLGTRFQTHWTVARARMTTARRRRGAEKYRWIATSAGWSVRWADATTRHTEHLHDPTLQEAQSQRSTVDRRP